MIGVRVNFQNKTSSLKLMTQHNTYQLIERRITTTWFFR